MLHPTPPHVKPANPQDLDESRPRPGRPRSPYPPTAPGSRRSSRGAHEVDRRHRAEVRRQWPGRPAPVALAMLLGVAGVAAASATAAPRGGAGEAAASATGEAADSVISFAAAFFVSRGSVLGTAIIWFLLCLSAFGVGLIFYLWLHNRRAAIAPRAVLHEIRHRFERRDFRGLLDLVSRDRSHLSTVVLAALRESPHGYPAMVRALEAASDEDTARRMRPIELLSVIGNVAPMIGLFGTVYGMILAFQGIVAAGGRPDPVDLAGGIGTALTTTFWGLVVAIPSLAAYAVIRNSIDTLTGEAFALASEVVTAFRPSPTAGASNSGSAPGSSGAGGGEAGAAGSAPAPAAAAGAAPTPPRERRST